MNAFVNALLDSRRAASALVKQRPLRRGEPVGNANQWQFRSDDSEVDSVRGRRGRGPPQGPRYRRNRPGDPAMPISGAQTSSPTSRSAAARQRGMFLAPPPITRTRIAKDWTCAEVHAKRANRDYFVDVGWECTLNPRCL
jgi:hypothetical protein